MRPIQELTDTQARGVKYVLMDIDDTLTKEGKLVPEAYRALWDLHSAGLRCIPVTGRPAGWCDLIARQWPVDAVVGENGALVFWEEATTGGEGLPVLKQYFHPHAVRNSDPRLKDILTEVLQIDARLRVAKDQPFRLFDIAVDFAEEEPVLPLDTAVRVAELARSHGAHAKVSSIHVNMWMGNYDKLSMARDFLRERFGWDPAEGKEEVIFVGDSPNDEPMFAAFPLSCAVANIRNYTHLIKHGPAFVANRDGGDGFAEIAEQLLSLRRGSGSSTGGSPIRNSIGNSAGTVHEDSRGGPRREGL
ncbi:HAD-IIB family hydrolase [Treponema sp. J25]|uniref:HAD-IIB family hydrolase n=1 Tax=Treponema sp. J25 TaxID=2094121 RepID=UPI00105242FD|nr:HAD-IIB family hydrolase [Treponema sp. J25]TCW60911.1 HAD family phosphatase [Treponema sp. J25]